MSIYGDTQENAEIKVVVLYFIHRLRIAPSSALITHVMLENRFLNYFQLQQCLHELAHEGYLSQFREDDMERYEITEPGKRILNMFACILPAGIRLRLDENIDAIRKDFRTETAVKADYTLLTEDEYAVRLKIQEDDKPLIDLQISVGTRDDARNICQKWKTHASELYPAIISLLLSSPTSPIEDE